MIPKCAPYFGDIIHIKSFLEFFFESSFVENELNKLKMLRGKRNYSYLIPVEIHPAAQILECLNFLTKNNPSAFPNEYGHLINDLAILSLSAPSIYQMCNNDLNSLGHPRFIKRLKDRCLDRHGFRHVIYELEVASIMHRLGKKVHFEDVSDKKWPDLQIVDSNRQFYVECKCLEAPRSLYEHLVVDVFRMLEKAKKNVRIDIVIERHPSDMAAVSAIVREIDIMLKAGMSHSSSESINDISIETLDKFYENEISLPSKLEDPDFVSMAGWVKRNDDGTSLWKDARLVAIKNRNRPLPGNAVKREIAKGYKQVKNIPGTAFGIICIDVSPYITNGMSMTSLEFMAVIDDAKKAVKELFDSPHYKELSGVIITWNYQRASLNGIVRLTINVDAMVHEKVQHPMPKNFTDGEFTSGSMVFIRRNPSLMTAKGIELAKAARHEESIEYFDMVTLHFPQMIEGWINKAISLRKINRQLDALISIKKALEIEPQNKLALINLAQCYVDLKMIDNAQKALDDMVNLFPNDAEVLYNKALFCHVKGDREAAKQFVLLSLSSDPNYESAKILSKELGLGQS